MLKYIAVLFLIITTPVIAASHFTSQDVERIKISIAYDAEHNALAPRIDAAVKAIIARTVKVLTEKGYDSEASQIESEYKEKFDGFLTNMISQKGDIGDYGEWSKFLGKVHVLAHERLGDTLCKFLHVHDLFIIDYGVPVVFWPSKYDLETYQNHFTGIHLIGPFWDHYGLVPVIVYWTVEIICDAATSGVAVFACGPIAGLAEDFFGIYVSPKVGKKVWTARQDY